MSTSEKAPGNHIRLTLLLILAVSVGLVLAPFATAQESLGPYPDRFEPPAKSDKPILVSIVITPKELTRNSLNKLKMKFSFKDDGKNLKGGFLELEVKESNGRKVNIKIDLKKKRYDQAKGKGKAKTELIVGNCNWVKFKAKLRDAAGKLSRAKKVKLTVPEVDDGGGGGDQGPPWGTKLLERAENFTLRDKDGNDVSLHDYWGSVILVDFSPQWCGPCQAEAADAEQLYQTYKNQGFIILTVLFEDYGGGPISQSACRAWAETYGLTFPVLADSEKKAWNMYDESNIVPLNIIISRTMVIEYKDVGYDENIKKLFEEKIEELLAQ